MQLGLASAEAPDLGGVDGASGLKKKKMSVGPKGAISKNSREVGPGSLM